MTRLKIRVRLTLWYGLLMTVTLAGLGVATWLLMARSMLDRVDANLDFEFHEAAERLAQGRLLTIAAELPSAFHEVYHLRVIDRDGRIVTESPTLAGIPATTASTPALAGGPSTHASVTLGALGDCRLVSGPADQNIIQIATSLKPYQRELSELTGILWTILPGGLVVGSIGGYWLAGRALAPVSRMILAARRISAANLSDRLPAAPPGRRDELGLLAETLNAMLDRIDLAFQSVRRFTANAAHELRTPLATIRTEAEVALAGSRSADLDAETLRSIVEEADRLAQLSERLLILSRADAGTAIRRESVRLDAIIRESAAVHSQRSRMTGQESLPPIVVEGDPHLLRVVFDNLLENAEKAGDVIRLKARIEGHSAIVEVIDNGIGIPDEALPRIFERFFRADPSRSRRTGGSGLGLSIVQAVVERHGGKVEVDSVSGLGSTFRIILPTSNSS